MEPAQKTGCTRDTEGFLKNSGPRVRLGKLEAIRFAKHLGAPVPAAHEFSADTKTISMDFVEGDILESVWPTMSDTEKESIAQQLRRTISFMRTARQDNFSIGAINGPVHECRTYSSYSGGPLEEEKAFNDFTLDLFTLTPQPIRESLRTKMLSDHSIRFTHGDLSPRNIIVENGTIQAIIDWEYAGWFPEHIAYVKFFECYTTCDDWKNFAPIISESTCEDELVIKQATLRW